MEVLAIGNSFSSDATRYLQDIAGEELYVRNLYIGGCSLERHVMNALCDNVDYEYQMDAKGMYMTTLKEALRKHNWDYITLQQKSGHSGVFKSCEPFLGQMIAYINRYAPKATIVWFQTWAYEIDSGHGDFGLYEKNQQKMYEKIIETSNQIKEKYQLPILPTGVTIQTLRETVPEFDYLNGGKSLCRDGFHLTYDYGRYAAALSWYRFFTKKPVGKMSFAPEGTDMKLIQKIQSSIDKN